MQKTTGQSEELQPRERLEQEGISALTNSELLAIVFNVGTKYEPVSALAAKVIQDYGITALAGVSDYRKLEQFLGLTRLKAMQAAAVLELGRRIYLDRRGTRPQLNSADKVYKRFRYLSEKRREELRALYLNSRQLLIASELIAVGSVDYISSYKRDIIAPALEYNAASVVIVHNHPSGNPQPSEADIEFTKQLDHAAQMFDINLQDHLIIGSEGYFSFFAAGLLGG